MRDLDRSTVQLFIQKKGTFVPDRTGVLFRVGESHFIITAAHYLPGHSKDNTPLFVPPSKSGECPTQLVGRTLVTEQETVDVAVWELTQAVVEQLAPDENISRDGGLGLADRQPQRSLPDLGISCLSCTIVSPEAVRPSVLKYLAYIFSGDVDAVQNFDPSTHILLQHQRHGQTVQGQAFSVP